MAETALTTAQADALSGTTDSDADNIYPTIGESTYYTTWFKWAQRLITMAKMPGNALRVYKDGDLTFGVRAGAVMNGADVESYAGASAQALTDDQTNYIYFILTSGALALTVSTSSFPTGSTTPFIPLAEIVCASGAYAYTDITDRRDRGLFGWCTGMDPANENTLTDASNADALHVHAVAGLQAAVQDLMPNVNITAGTEAGNARTITFQVRDAANNNLAHRCLVRVWESDAEYGAPDDGGTWSIDTGTEYEQDTANAAYLVISDASGTIAAAVTIAGAATRYFHAELDGRIYSSGAVEWAA